MGDTRSHGAWVTGLALAAAAGDRGALTTFVRATQRDVYRFLVHLCDLDEAEDLTQETYLRALRALPGFAGRSGARTWLLSIARRVAADQIRRKMISPRTTWVQDWEAALATAGPARLRSGWENGVVLRQMVAGLEPGRREAFVLTQMLGLSYAAAAEVCCCPIGTIRSRVARARGDLIRALNPLDPADPGATAAPTPDTGAPGR
jgi:RNA polymerase sigma-70 factor, ECF subfamily